MNISTLADDISRKFEQETSLFGVLNHPARLAILETLRDGEECVCHMEAHLGYRQAYLSQQLSVLRQAGLVQVRKDSRNVYYRVLEPKVFDVIDAARGILGEKVISLQKAEDCPCPRCAGKLNV